MIDGPADTGGQRAVDGTSPFPHRPPPWTLPAWSALTRAHQADRLPHALLITGPVGVGKGAFAKAFAEALLCANPTEEGMACGGCSECRLLAAGNHPDCLRVGPDPDAKSPEIRVDAIRDLIGREGLTSHRGRHKVVLIEPAHQLNRAAANSLLKTLEEPSASTLMLLVSEAPGRLTATIRSRCQRILLPLPHEDLGRKWLADRAKGADARLLLRLAHGAPFAALALLDDGQLERRDALFKGFVEVLNGVRDPIAEAEAWNMADARLSCEWLAGWIGDILRLAAAPGARHLDHPDKTESLADLVPTIDMRLAHRYLQRVYRAGALAGTTVNKRLLLESLLIGLANLRRPRC